MSSIFLSTLSAKNYPFSCQWLPQPAYLVGGAVRDALLQRRSEYLDLDFVLPVDAVKVARAIAKHYQAGFVLLDAERQIARVVFQHATVDFAQQEGDTLETDLRRRDFTINAIAYNPHTEEIIDPLQGGADLQQGLLRMVSAENLQDDPLRLLRAYRQAAQLGFAIEANTQAVIRQLAPEISKVAAERVRVELGYLLGCVKGSEWLQTAWEDGLLTTWFPSATRSLTQLLAIDSAAATLSQTFPPLGAELRQPVREPLKTTWLDIAKLACLVSQEPELAEAEMMQLTYSRAEIRAVTTALKLLPQLKQLSLTGLSLPEQYFLFRTAGAVFPTLSVLAVAFADKMLDIYAPLINRYLNPSDPVAHPTPLVTGKDLMQALKLPSSPLIGELLTQVQIAQIEGKISTPQQAIKFASQIIDCEISRSEGKRSL